MTIKREPIEVALPLEAINKESAREKSGRGRHRHPGTLRLSWPLAVWRVVLFASLVIARGEYLV